MLESLWSGIIPPKKGTPTLPHAPKRLEAIEAGLWDSQPGDILPSEVAGDKGAVAGGDAVDTGVEGKQGIADDMVTKLALSPGSPSGEETEGAVR